MYIQDCDTNDDNDVGDDYSCNSVNFQDRTFRFCMEVDLDHTFDMLMMIFNYKIIKFG